MFASDRRLLRPVQRPAARSWLLVVFLFFAWLAGPAAAEVSPQLRTGSIAGTVLDLNGEPLVGITVHAAGSALPAERIATTDERGRYRFVLLPPGSYELTFALGDRTLVRRAVVTVGDAIVVNASLELYQFGVEVSPGIVEVPTPPPGIDREGTWVGSNIDGQMLQEVPDARDLWSVLANRVPGVLTSTYNIGGSESGLQPDFEARGASFTQSSLAADGVKFVDPFAIGAAGFYFDIDAVAEMQVSTSSHSIEAQTPGVNVNLVTRSGGNDFHGSGQLYWTNGSWQSDNLSDRQRQLGLTEGTSVDLIADTSVQLGGPAVRDRLAFFTSFRYFSIDRKVAGFPETESTTYPSWLLKGNWQINEGNQVWGSYMIQWYDRPNRDASALIAPEATFVEDDRTSILQGNWQSSLGPETMLDVRAAALDIDLRLDFRDDITGQSTFAFDTGVSTRSSPFSTASRRRRLSTHALLKHFATTGRGTHDLTFGFQFDHSAVDSDFEVIDSVNLETFMGFPATVLRFNTPLAVQNDVNVTSLFGEDVWSFGPVTLGLGLRGDLTTGWLPAQSSPAGPYVPARSFAGVEDVISWRALVPRVRGIWDLLGNGLLAAKASYSAYSDQLGASLVSFANPNAPSLEAYLWDDLNGDLQYQPGEEAFFLGAAGARVGTIARDFSAPITQELTLGLDYAFAPGWIAGTAFVYRHQNDLQEGVNIGLTDADFVPVEVEDPAGGTINVFNQVSGFGNDLFELRNVAAKDLTYRGLDLTLERRHRDGWHLLAGLTVAGTDQLGGKSGFVPGDPGGTSDLFDNPNAQISARGKSPWDRAYILKVSGTYTAPYEILVGGVLRSQSGAPLARILPIELNQGFVEVFADARGFDRLPTLTTVDLRVGKELEMPRGATANVTLDVFNLANASATTQAAEREPLFGLPLMTLAPRTVRIGARVVF